MQTLLDVGLPPSLIALYLVQGLLIVASASLIFDTIHWALHLLSRQRSPLLRAIGAMHDVHHAFFDEGLVRHPELWKANVRMRHIPEFLTQMAVCSVFFLAFDPLPVVGTMIVLSVVFAIVVLVLVGKDANHTPREVVRAPTRSLWVFPEYHLHHHVHPTSFFGSYFRLFDVVMGTSCPLAGRRFVVTGGHGAFGAPIVELLRAYGAADVKVLPFQGPSRAGSSAPREALGWTYDDISRVEGALAEADVLVLTHGSKVEMAMAANCTSFVDFIERFKELTRDRRLPVEVWATGSEIEAHPAFGIESLRVYLESKRAYARHARRYYRDTSLVYRHIVCSAFTSPMGPGLMSGRTAARVALFFIRRGFRYVPVTYTGIALLNFFKFLLPFGSAPPPPPSPAGKSERARPASVVPEQASATPGLPVADGGARAKGSKELVS
jgi:monoglucosyldiacylglycerol epimerase